MLIKPAAVLSWVMAAGLSLNNLAKILKCAGNDDVVTMKAADDGDTVTLMFESPSESVGEQGSIHPGGSSSICPSVPCVCCSTVYRLSILLCC
jgi:hypothetical protein